MTGLGNLIRRNIRLFFKDKGMFFSSLITPIILLVLYVTFLAKVYRDSFASAIPQGITVDEKIINAVVACQLISSLLAVSCVTVAFCSNLLMINDKVNGAIRDLIISLITLKYTQSNSVCFAYDGQAIGVGAGQQSRIHCTRLAGNKADIWFLRQHPKILNLPFVDNIRRPDRDNTIDVYISDDYEDVLADGVWEQFFKTKPEPLTREEKKEWLATFSGVSLGSDAFFPFGDNIERAKRSGVQYVAQPGGSIRDDNVIDTCNKYGMTMSFTGIRLFHH